MKKQDFYFELPQELIAQYPVKERSHSRLLSYQRNDDRMEHHFFYDLPHLLKAGDLLVMNDSKVIPARVFGKKESGGQLEMLVERLLDDYRFLAHIKGGRALRSGQSIILESGSRITVVERRGELFLCESNDNVLELLNNQGHMPLPPYIARQDESLDEERYQTIYARNDGSVAAPTAGLHFDEKVMTALASVGVQVAYVTLHVGAGTFQPVRCEDIKNHHMHSERYVIDDALCKLIYQTKKQGGRVIAVGTTAMRTLESGARWGALKARSAETDIFIYPGYEFKICDGLITNFHLPESTLLMLVAAFIGQQQMKTLYQEAICHQYRFFSYGDASLLL